MQQQTNLPQERIGHFEVLRKIATGGMAELFLAKQVGMEGFEKVVAIKRILAHLAFDQEFINMFRDEARIVAKLTHPNIVQIYDLGKADDTYFIAMEYIPGRNLSSVAKKAKTKGQKLPPEYIARCMAQACEGLHYAHTRHDSDGKPLKIVHRDVSPQNIILAFSGGVKLVDFGIAKAATKFAHTRAGVLKGKYAYMSPEQIRGEEIDARSDLFAVGIVLYELLCGRRPFEKENSIQTLKAIVQEPHVDCRALNRDIPDTLASIIDKALEKSPVDRWQSAQDLQVALEDYASEAGRRSNTIAISKWVTDLFAEELSQEKGGTIVLKGVGEVILPAAEEPPEKNVERERAPTAGVSLSRGRGGGSVEARPPIPAPSLSLSTADEEETATRHPARPRSDSAGAEAREALIEEGFIERPADAGSASGGYSDDETAIGGPGLTGSSEDVDGLGAEKRDGEARFDDSKTEFMSKGTPPAPQLENLTSPPIPSPRGSVSGTPSQSRSSVGVPPKSQSASAQGPGGSGQGRPLPNSSAKSVALPHGSKAIAPSGVSSKEPPATSGVRAPSARQSGAEEEIDALSSGDVQRLDELTSDPVEVSPRGLDDLQAGPSLDERTRTGSPWDEATLGATEDGADELSFGDDDPFVEKTIDASQANLSSGHGLAGLFEHGADRGRTLGAGASSPEKGDTGVENLEDALPDSLPLEALIEEGDANLWNDKTTTSEALSEDRLNSSRVMADPKVASEGSSLDGLMFDELSGEDLDNHTMNEAVRLDSVHAPPATRAAPLDVELELPEPVAARKNMDLDARTTAGLSTDYADVGLAVPDGGAYDAPSEPDKSTGSESEDVPARPRPKRGGQGLGQIKLSRLPPEQGGTEDSSAVPMVPSSPSSPGRILMDEPTRPETIEEDFRPTLGVTPPNRLVAPRVPPPMSPPAEPKGAMAIGSTNVPPASLSMADILAKPTVSRSSTGRPRVAPSATVMPHSPGAGDGPVVARKIREVRSTSQASVSVSPAPVLAAELREVSGVLAPKPEAVAPAPRSARRLAILIVGVIALFGFGAGLSLFVPQLLAWIPSSEAQLTVRTEPDGAEVYLNGQIQPVRTPARLGGLRPGSHYELKVAHDGYEPVTTRIAILPNQRNITVQIPLKPSGAPSAN